MDVEVKELELARELKLEMSGVLPRSLGTCSLKHQEHNHHAKTYDLRFREIKDRETINIRYLVLS